MFMVQYFIDPPEYWYHDPNIQNNDNDTVAMLTI